MLYFDSTYLFRVYSTDPGHDMVIYEFSETGIETVSYRDSQPCQMTSRFLKNPETMLEKLLSA